MQIVHIHVLCYTRPTTWAGVYAGQTIEALLYVYILFNDVTMSSRTVGYILFTAQPETRPLHFDNSYFYLIKTVIISYL